MKKRKLIIILIALIIVSSAAIGLFIYTKHKNNQNIVINKNLEVNPAPSTSPTPTPQPTVTPSPTAMPTPTAVVAPTARPTTAPAAQWPVTYTSAEAASLQVVVNKKHKLPSTYAPGLRAEASSAISQLYNDAAAQGYNLKTVSAYRSYSSQTSIYNNYVARDGQALADTYSARPGHSEHQTGLAIDVGLTNGSCDLEICFGDTPAGKWVAANAQNYGFIVRYPNGKQAETGYQYEPWHLRFLGVDAAKAVAASGKTLDQYYNVEAGGY